MPGLRHTVSQLRLPGRDESPTRAIWRRLLLALFVLLVVVGVVYTDRGGYRDVNDDGVSLLDALYYATVSLSTTGYGDITPVSDGARLVNVVFITPMRVLFLIILIGTTLEVLTQRTREQWQFFRWRASLGEHTVVIGYGTKGRSAVRALIEEGHSRRDIVIVDPSPAMVEEANRDGLAAILGDATRGEILDQARIKDATRVLVAPQRDDTAVLVTLTVRQRNATALVIASAREAENAPLLRQSGANSVVVSSEAAGRLLGLSSSSPATGQLIEELLVPHQGLDFVERPAEPAEIGVSLTDLPSKALALVRDGKLHRLGTAEAVVRAGDLLIEVRPARVDA